MNALVTGSSRGIGLSTARLLAQNGYLVYGTYNSTKLEPEPGIVPIQADLRRREDISRIFDLVPHIDLLVNNAGISQYKPFLDITEEDFDEMMNINLKSVFLTSQMAVSRMVKRQTGCIINISSIWGVLGGGLETHYSAAKAGVIGLTRALAQEIAPIRVNAIAPGPIDTDMCKNYNGIKGNPQFIAETVLFLAKNEFITGEVINATGGFR